MSMIHEEIVTYEVSKLAKEKRFPQEFDYAHFKSKLNYYNHQEELNGDVGDILKLRIKHKPVPEDMQPIAAPTQSLLQRWLREEKKVHIEIAHNPMYGGFMPYICKIVEGEEGVFTLLEKNSHCIVMRNATYENALEAGLKYVLEKLV